MQNALNFTIVLGADFCLALAVLRLMCDTMRLITLDNPMVVAIYWMTQRPIMMVRGVVGGRGSGRFDRGAVTLVVLVSIAKQLLVISIDGLAFNAAAIAVLCAADIIEQIIWILFIAMLARVIFSWVAPRSTAPPVFLIVGFTEPLLAPVRRFLPSIGGLDFSPLVLLLVLRAVQHRAIEPLAQWGLSLM